MSMRDSLLASRTLAAIVLLAVSLLLAACQSLPPRRAITPLALIPEPVSVERTPGTFSLRQGAVLNVRADNAAALGVARHFADLLARTRGLHLDVHPFGTGDSRDGMLFVLDPHLLVRGDQGDEGYELTVSSRRIVLAARTPHGLFNGSVTLWQLLTRNTTRKTMIEVPCVHIEDYPRFAWRGLMLDSARHFQSPQFIKHLLDAMALHKLDVLHWHLTDDQGWRIEIKRYPALTRIGAWRIPASVPGSPVPPGYGGFYTQDQIREIVRYAAQRYITLVPEIEMPGHAQAAIAAYPQLGVTGKRPPVSSDWGVHTYLYNVQDSTFTFLQNVLTEVMHLFPGRYIHVGGDEAAKDQWLASTQVQRRRRALGIKNEAALQSYFIDRIGRFLGTHGRTLIGWDEILQGGLPASAVVMSWQGVKGGIAAARLGHDVVMAPSPLMYFDHVQSARHDEPPGRPEVVSLADVYAYEPVPAELDAAQARHVLGAQANLWTEYMDTPQRVEHAAFPRAAALAEVLWSPRQERNWPGFLARMPAQFARYRALGIAFADSAFAASINAQAGATLHSVKVEMSTQTHFGQIRYTLDGSEPTSQSAVYQHSLLLTLPVQLRVRSYAGERALSAVRTQVIDAASLRRKNSDELLACKPGQGLPLRLPGPGDGGAVYRVDIFDPCWIYPQADLDAVGGVAVAAAELPYNFQLWHDADKVVVRQPTTPAGELDVRLDTCSGAVLATIPLAAAARTNAPANLQSALPAHSGKHDLCFYFTRPAQDPLWAIDRVQLLPKP